MSDDCNLTSMLINPLQRMLIRLPVNLTGSWPMACQLPVSISQSNYFLSFRYNIEHIIIVSSVDEWMLHVCPVQHRIIVTPMVFGETTEQGLSCQYPFVSGKYLCLKSFCFPSPGRDWHQRSPITHMGSVALWHIQPRLHLWFQVALASCSLEQYSARAVSAI